MTQVAILGCGPAGLLAAEAVEQAGHQPVIFSLKHKSQMFGAMYLHERIPGVTGFDPDYNIEVIKSGTKEGYAKLVYGDPAAPCSWDLFPSGTTRGWNLRAAYDKLWEKYESGIIDAKISLLDLEQLVTNYAVVYSSLPAPAICAVAPGQHEFDYQSIWVLHGDGTPYLLRGVNDHNLMYYNGYPPDGFVAGTLGPDWYRYSQLDRYQCWEYSQFPEGVNDERYKLSLGTKPISNTCDCWPTVRRIGRFGSWTKGVLTHHVFQQVLGEANGNFGIHTGIV